MQLDVSLCAQFPAEEFSCELLKPGFVFALTLSSLMFLGMLYDVFWSDEHMV